MTADNKAAGRATILRIATGGTPPITMHTAPPPVRPWSDDEIARRITRWLAEQRRQGRADRISVNAAVVAVWQPHKASASRRRVRAIAGSAIGRSQGGRPRKT